MPARRPRTMPKLVQRDDAPPLLDGEALYIEMRDAIESAGSYDDAHADLIPIVKAAVVNILQTAEALLLEDRGGLACAQRLSLAEDILIQTLYRVVTEYRYPLVNPRRASASRFAPSGGYGRGTLGPQSDIDLLFLRPAKQTPWGEQVVESLLYFLWDCGFKVGHATRTVDECVKLAKTDMTIRTALFGNAVHSWRCAAVSNIPERVSGSGRQRLSGRIRLGQAWRTRCPA